MDRRLILPLLAAAALVSTVVPRPHWGASSWAAQVATAEPGADASSAQARDLGGGVRGPRHARATPRPRLAPDTVDAALAVDVSGDATAARFSLAVVNTADRRVEVNFPDGRTRDFAVYDAAGREVWRWSRGRLFTQLMQNKLLTARDSAVYAGAWPSPAPGRYTVVAELRSDNHPIRRTAAFVVPAPVPAGRRGRGPGRPSARHPLSARVSALVSARVSAPSGTRRR
jgi:hypothetical protein